MAPLLHADDGRNVVIRPLVYVPENDIVAFASRSGFPILPSCCPACANAEMKRSKNKKLLDQLEEEQPGIKSSLAFQHFATSISGICSYER